MRSDLSARRGVFDVETNVEEQTCSFRLVRRLEPELKAILDELAEKNDKLADWSVVEE